jgi:choline dehydrogenase-like flavoprotein
VNAKADAQVCCIDPALATGHVELYTNTLVERLLTSASGREVTGVEVVKEGERLTLSASLVVSSCGAINSAALLLRSANDAHPNGLANGSGQLGRNYMCHINSVMLALSLCPNPTVFQKTFALNDFYWGDSDWKYPMGHISFVGKTDEYVLAAGAPKFVPGWTLEQMARHSLDFWLTSEDLPDPANRVTLARDGRTQLAYTANNHEGHERLQAKLQSLLGRIPCPVHGDKCIQGVSRMNAYVGKRIPLAGVAHQNGTARFGTDPRSSVLDTHCRAHEVDNLYVVDGSFFPSSSAVNPALTIMANALRVAEHLKARLGVTEALAGAVR